MKLYFNPRSRAVIAKWMLDECGADYEIVHIDFEKKEHKTPEFLRINPAGKLPALVDGTTRIFENAAIGLYLGDKFPASRLAPPIDSPLRGRYLSLMVYSTSQIEPSLGDRLLKQPTPPPRGWNDFETVKDAVERELGDGPWLFGQQFSMADIMIGSMFMWQKIMGGKSERPIIDTYLARLAARPAAIHFD
jgi:glutathione S-transferase